MSSLKQIAEKAGVSTYTVSKIVNGKAREARISDERVREVTRIARELNYRPNAAARAMAGRRTRSVGVVLPNHPGNRNHNPRAFEVVLGVNHGLQEAGYVLAMTRLSEVEDSVFGQSRFLDERIVDGMIVFDAMPACIEERLEDVISDCIWLDGNVWRPECCVRRDERQAGRLAAQAVLDAGYTRAVWIDQPKRDDVKRHYSYEERLQGIHDVLDPAGIPLEAFSVGVGVRTHDWLTGEARPDHDTALITYSYSLAEHVAHAAADRGVTAPADFGLVSCDGAEQVAWTWPDLARVDVDRYEMGRQAAAMMVALLETPQQKPASLRVEPQWHAGNSLHR